MGFLRDVGEGAFNIGKKVTIAAAKVAVAPIKLVFKKILYYTVYPLVLEIERRLYMIRLDIIQALKDVYK